MLHHVFLNSTDDRIKIISYPAICIQFDPQIPSEICFPIPEKPGY